MFETLYTLKFHSRCAFDVHTLFIGFADRLIKIIKNSDKHPYSDMGLPHFDMKDIKTKNTISDILEPDSYRAIGDKSTVSISFRTSGGTFKHYYDFELNTYLPYEKEHISFIETEFVVKSDRKLREDAALYKPEVNSFVEWFGRHLEIMLYTTYRILSDSRDSKLTNLRKDVLDFIDREMFSNLLSEDGDLRGFSFETRGNDKIPLQQDARFDFKFERKIVFSIVVRYLEEVDKLTFVRPKTTLKDIDTIPTNLNPRQTHIIKGFMDICQKHVNADEVRNDINV